MNKIKKFTVKTMDQKMELTYLINSNVSINSKFMPESEPSKNVYLFNKLTDEEVSIINEIVLM